MKAKVLLFTILNININISVHKSVNISVHKSAFINQRSYIGVHKNKSAFIYRRSYISVHKNINISVHKSAFINQRISSASLISVRRSTLSKMPFVVRFCRRLHQRHMITMAVADSAPHDRPRTVLNDQCLLNTWFIWRLVISRPCTS